MHLAYSSYLTEDSVTLDTDESLHITKVLRLGLGDQIMITDGKGTKALGSIISAAKKNVTVSLSDIQITSACPYQFELAIAPTKLMDRFEIVLEKCTELGIRKIHPILTFHSERRKLNLDRCRKIVLSAMKQSQKIWLPEISEPKKFNEFISQCKTENKLLAHCENTIQRDSFKNHVTNSPTVLCIGPEGDFSLEEISLASERGFTSVHLGSERLRTETAALYAHSTYQAINTL